MALTLVDALDALVLMGRDADMAEAVHRLQQVIDFNMDQEVRARNRVALGAEGWLVLVMNQRGEVAGRRMVSSLMRSSGRIVEAGVWPGGG